MCCPMIFIRVQQISICSLGSIYSEIQNVVFLYQNIFQSVQSFLLVW